VLFHWRIRYKLLFGVTMLFCIVMSLAINGCQGSYAYRELAKTISQRATELPLAADLAQSIGDARVTLSSLRRANDSRGAGLAQGAESHMLREQFRTDLLAIEVALESYKKKIDQTAPADPLISDTRKERETVRRIEDLLGRITRLHNEQAWVFDDGRAVTLDERLEELELLSGELPTHLHRRMHDFADDVRAKYRTWIFVNYLTSLLAMLLLGLLVYYFYRLIVCPLRVLVHGSRRVADGDFSHRIKLNTRDEVGELAAAMNNMTAEFQKIYLHLDEQVKLRTKEVVRSEQLASVGFLAAGVAHEINNPLASIAWAAESLESRVHDIIEADDQKPDDQHNEEITVLRTYLRRIQDEAFRCKGITGKLLDFSRLGEVERQRANLGELTADVIEMVRHLGVHRGKQIEFRCPEPVWAPVNTQEIKQVLLNLLTNALDSLDPGGRVEVSLRKNGPWAEIVVADNGCGMTEEVLKHLFEPFFTRRRNGQGTGLGLSITYRIVTDHGGAITAASEGPKKGSQFRVTLPLTPHEKENSRRLVAA
jgi:signal transduction histidine kinase